MAMNAKQGLAQLATLRRVGRTHGNRGSDDFPSKVLHEVPKVFEDGLAVRRLEALADFIGGLPQFSGRVKTIVANRVHSECEIAGFVLRAGGNGYGIVHFTGDRTDPKQEVLAYYTGWGIICWGWGAYQGMSAVAENGMMGPLQDVLTAEPLRRENLGMSFSSAGPADVADALREFVKCRDAKEAWRKVAAWKRAGEDRPAPAAVAAPAPVSVLPTPKAPKVAQVLAGSLTGREKWKGLLASEDYEGMYELAAKQVQSLEEELKVWRRRLAVAEAGRDE